MILTIALNPSVVRQINIKDFEIGRTNEAVTDELSVGDCGIYSAYILKAMQADPYVMGISGGIGGRLIKNYLDRNRIKTDFLQVDHEIKTRLIIEDEVNKTITTVVSHNDVISQRDFINIKHKLNHHLSETHIVAVSGSDTYLPKMLDDIHAMSKEAKKIIVNVEGPIVSDTLGKKIYGALIDADDLVRLGINFDYSDESYEIIKNYQKMKQIKYLVVKTEDEIIGFAKNKICKVSYQSRDTIYPIVKSAIFGGLVVGVRRNYPFEMIMKIMGSLANGCSVSDYPFIIKRKEIDKGINLTKITEVYNLRNGFVN